MIIPLAERFHSIQGEGYWAGTPMHFIRLPGCTVGKPQGYAPPTLPGIEKSQAWQCHTFDGEAFWCDTDFHKYLEEESEAILSDTWETHLCLTGGEPLMHKAVVDHFRTQCQLKQVQLHIETSGTIDFWWEMDLHPLTTYGGGHDPRDPWLTVSPKQGWTPYMIAHASELKLLVHEGWKDPKFVLDPAFFRCPFVYLSPVNNVGAGGLFHPSSRENVDTAFEWLHRFPRWRLSVQLHKYLGVR